MPHLHPAAITNYRRSGATSEPISWDVEYGTTFEKIEELRNMMMEFVEHEKVGHFSRDLYDDYNERH